MKVYWKTPKAVLALEAETAADLDILGHLHLMGPLVLARPTWRPADASITAGLRKAAPDGALLLCALDWELEGCPAIGRALSPLERAAAEAGREIGGTFLQLLGLALGQPHGGGLVGAPAAVPQPQEQLAAGLEKFELVKKPSLAEVRRLDRRLDEVKCTHGPALPAQESRP